MGDARGAEEEFHGPARFRMVSPRQARPRFSDPGCGPAVQGKGRLVIAIDGQAVRGARDKDGKAPHLVGRWRTARRGHRQGRRNREVDRIRGPGPDERVHRLAGTVITIAALHTQSENREVITGAGRG